MIVRKLIDIQKALGLTVDEMVPVVTTDLREEPYTLNEVCIRRESLITIPFVSVLDILLQKRTGRTSSLIEENGDQRSYGKYLESIRSLAF